MTTYNENQVREYIKENLEDWLFTGNHINENHINADIEVIKQRLNRRDKRTGKIIITSSTFIDSGSGDEICEGILTDLLSKTSEITKWLQHDGRSRFYYLRFNRLPYGVTGISISAEDMVAKRANSYCVTLCKEKGMFFVLNAFPEYIE